MGNAKSASFEVEHLPTSERKNSVGTERFSFNRNYQDHMHRPERPVSLYASVYAESSTSDNSKESETMSTLSSTSTNENHDHGVFERTKTAPMIIPEIVEPEEEFMPVTRRRSKSWQPESSHYDSFFDQIVDAIEQEAGKTSPIPSRRSTAVSSSERRGKYHKKRWSTMFT